MNYFNRIPIPITFASEEKVKEVYIRTYPDNEMHLLQDSYSISKGKQEKCTLLWLNPGKCLYQFIINNTKHLNLQKPIDKTNNDYFNILLVTKESTDLKENAMNLKSNFKLLIGKEKDKSLTLEDNNLLTLSIKAENQIQEIVDQDKFIQLIPYKGNNEEDNDNENDQVIVYKYNNDYLIEMLMTPYESDNPDLICLKYYNNPNTDICIVNKNKVFFQITKSFDKSTDISKLKTINELTIIKTIHHCFLNKTNYIIASDIMLVFYSCNNNNELIVPSHMINAFISIGENCLIVIKGKETEELINMIKAANDSMTDSQLSNVFSLCKLLKESTLLHINIKNNDIQFNLLPVIHSQDTTTNYNNKSILIHKDQNQTKLVNISLEASKEIHKINFNEEDKDTVLEFCNHNARVINIIYNIMSKCNLIHLFKDFLKGLFVCYLLLVYYKTENDDSTDYIPEQNMNENLVIYYSNIMTVALVRILLQLIPMQFKNERNNKGRSNCVINKAFLLIYSNNESQDKEYAHLINEILYRRHLPLSSQSMNKMNSDLIGNVLLKYFNESLRGWKSQISNYFTNEILSRYDSVFTSLQLYKYITDQQRQKVNEQKPKLIDILTDNIHKGFISLQNSELSNMKLKQLIYVCINSSIETFLFSNIEQIVLFIHYHKLIHYANDGISKHFCHLSIRDFCKHFLPLLSDISNPISNHEHHINHFIIDLQTLQKINEKFVVNADGVFFGFQMFEVIVNLIHRLKNDKAILIQSYFKKNLIEQVVNRMRVSIIIIQNKWRNYYYKSMTDTHINKNINASSNTNDFLPLYLINKYKKKDALLLKYLLGIKKITTSLIKDNIKLKQKYTIFNCQQSTNFNFKSQMSQKRNCEWNINSSSSSNVFDNNLKQNNTHTKSFYISSTSLRSLNPKLKKASTNNQSNINNKDNNDMHYTDDMFKENNEIKTLNGKIEESKRKYRDMIILASEYEKKIDGLISLINSKDEVREILKKNGVQFT